MHKIYAVLMSITILLITGYADISYSQQVMTISTTPSSPLMNTSSQSQSNIQKTPVNPVAEGNETLNETQDLNQKESLPEGEVSENISVESKDISPFEQYLTGDVPVSVSTAIEQFGYDLFSGNNSAYIPSLNLPVGSDYVIGPDDQILISLWGKVEGNWEVTVDRDGNISLPKVGTIGVNGLNFTELKQQLHKEFSKYYTGFQINVSMGALRSLRIYVVGNAEKPGAYTVSSLSTLVSALFQSGGPAKSGTMRDIQLKRNGEIITRLDLYDFILKGDKTNDVRLMPEDVIFIPSVGPLVALAGQVTVPAIYEIKGDTSITDIISMAGGISATGYLQKIQLERVHNNSVKILIDTDINKISANNDINILKDRDIIKIYPISNIITNAINVTGNVMRPGQYQWSEGMKISDLFEIPETALLPETYYRHAMLERFMPPDYHKEIISFHLGKALFEKNASDNINLLPYDTLTVYSKWDYEEKPVVHTSGAVQKPAEYELTPNMKISDLIKLSGGLQRYAFTETAELTRVTITQEGPKTEKITLNLDKAVKEDPEHDILLKEDDFLFIRTIPEWKLYQTVTIEGEVKFPGTYTITKGDKLSSLIERAGGYTEKAYLRGAVFKREKAKEMQQKSLNQMVDRVEREIILSSSAKISTAVSHVEVRSKEAEIEQSKIIVESMRKIAAEGRVSIMLSHLRLLKNSEFDIELDANDVLFIPQKSNMINVIGSVISNGSHIYSENFDLEDYIGMSGGYTKHADKKNSYILKADGTAMELGGSMISWNKNKSRWAIAGLDDETRSIEPGDTIVIPENLERIAWLREIKDFTQILYQIAVTAGVVINVL
ncbi:MAG: SLBB domain-containing protein [Nitrospira sp.]|nr:SLBB domain-containing protein [bacterium]MBL7050369.1 SLBB domain-containing protein [Nitrospira sp.]